MDRPPGDVRLRDASQDDLRTFFEHQRDPVANEMAALPARDLDAFLEHWMTRILGDRTVVAKTVLALTAFLAEVTERPLFRRRGRAQRGIAARPREVRLLRRRRTDRVADGIEEILLRLDT